MPVKLFLKNNRLIISFLANPQDSINCSNLELILGYEFFGKIILKSFNERQNVHFRFDRNIQLNGNLDSSTETLVRQRNSANGIGW